MWVGRLFYIPAFAGGIFGLLGGYLTDRLGRRRVLTWSILLYAVSAFLAGFSTSVEMLLVLRCTTFVGVCVEFVAAVAWLAELFPEPVQREKVLGYTQAFSSIGGLLVAYVNIWAVNNAASLPAIQLPEWLAAADAIRNPHAAWRYTLMSGLIPAIPLVIIRPFLPESPAWAAKKAAGTLRRPSIARALRASFPQNDDRHDADVRLQLRRGVRRHSTRPADRPGPTGGQSGNRRSARAGRQRDRTARRRESHHRTGIRRSHRSILAGDDRRPHRQPPRAVATVPIARPDHRADSCSLTARRPA